MTASFPRDSEQQTYVSVKALVAGHVWLTDKRMFLDAIDAPEGQGHWLPAFSFLITHPTKGNALFDLGVRKVSKLMSVQGCCGQVLSTSVHSQHAEGYPPALVERVKSFKPDCPEDAADILRSGGVDAAEINFMIYRSVRIHYLGRS